MQYSEVGSKLLVTPKKCLTDNGGGGGGGGVGGVANAEFLEISQAMNITVKVTAAE